MEVEPSGQDMDGEICAFTAQYYKTAATEVKEKLQDVERGQLVKVSGLESIQPSHSELYSADPSTACHATYR